MGIILNNVAQFVHVLPRFYAGRIQFVESTYGSNLNGGDRPEIPVKSITYALTKMTDDRDDLIVCLPNYDNDLTDAETNGDDTPIDIEVNGLTLLWMGRANFIKAIGSADSAIQIDANQVTIGGLRGQTGVYGHDKLFVKAAGAGTTSTVVEIVAAAVDADVSDIDTNDMGNYDTAVNISATSHRANIHHNRFMGDTTDTDQGVFFAGTVDGVRVTDNIIDECGVDASKGNIYSASIHTKCYVANNKIVSVVASKKGINFSANATGWLVSNYVYVVADADGVINGNCQEFNQRVNDAFTTQGGLVPARATITSDERAKVEVVFI